MREEGNISDPYTVAIIKLLPATSQAMCHAESPLPVTYSYIKGVLLYGKLLVHDVSHSSDVGQRQSHIARSLPFQYCDLSQWYLLFNTFPIHTFVASISKLDNKGTLMGSTTDKLEGKLGLFFVLYEKYFSQGHFALNQIPVYGF